MTPSVLRRALGRHHRVIVPAVLLLCLWQLCEASVPVAIGLVVDRAVIPRSVPALAVSVVALAALFTVLSLAYRFGSRLVVGAVNTESHALRVEVAGHALGPRGVRTGLLAGEVLSVATADADAAAWTLRELAATISAGVGVLVCTVYLVVADWIVGLIALLGVAAVLAAVQRLAPVISRASERRQEQIAAASGRATDLMRGLRVLKGIGGEKAAGDRYRVVSGRARDAGVATTSGVALAEGLSQVLLGIVVAVVLVVAGLRVLAGYLSLGQLIAVVGVATFVAEPMGTVTRIVSTLARSRVSARRIEGYLGSPPLVADGDAIPVSTGPALSIRGLVPLGGPPIDLDIARGELLAVVVDDVSVADDVAAAVGGVPRVDPGTVLVGGADRSRVGVEAARAMLIVVPRQPDVFAGSLADNVVAFAGPQARWDGDRLATVLDASACAELLGVFPDGLEHRLEAGGSTLSGGQRQRIALARALYADPPILVLSDPTTAVDAVTEAQIASGVRRLRHSDPGRPRATVVLGNSPAFLAAADRVVVLRRDAAMVVGRHAELMATSGGYRELVGR